MNIQSQNDRASNEDAPSTESATSGKNPADNSKAEIDDKRDPAPSKLSTEKQLDHGLKETFPASDPVSINPGAD